jgi:hypothetical protein
MAAPTTDSNMIAREIYIDHTDIGITSDAENYDQEAACQHLTAVIQARGITVRRGDIITTNPDKDRCNNANCFMWNGEEVVALYNGIDERGSVPPSIEVTDTEFHPRYWSCIIGCNTIFWLAQPILDRFHVYWDDDLRLHCASTVIGGRRYTVIIAPREDNELQAALDGKPVVSSETPADIEARIKDGYYYFEVSHPDLDCIDLQCKAYCVFYAIPMPVEEDIYDTDEERAAARDEYNERFSSRYYA